MRELRGRSFSDNHEVSAAVLVLPTGRRQESKIMEIQNMEGSEGEKRGRRRGGGKLWRMDLDLTVVWLAQAQELHEQ